MADGYDWTTEQNKLLMRQEMAKRLMATKEQEGQMVSGWYVPPSKIGMIGNALREGIGGYLTGLNSKAEADLNKKDREVYNKALGELLNPDNEAALAKAQDPANLPKANLDRFIENNQANWNADPNAAQAQPVAPQQMPQGQPLPPVGNLPPPQNVQPSPQAQAALQAPQGIIETPSSPQGPLQGAIQAQKGPDMTGVMPSAAEDSATQLGIFTRAKAAQRSQALQDLATTKDGGPLAKAITQKRLESMFGDKNGRYKTEVHADPVNGGFIKVVTDSATGETKTEPINANGAGKGKFTVETAADGTRMKVYANGGASEPIVDGEGKPLVDPTVLRTNAEAKEKTDKTRVEKANGIAMSKSILANLEEGTALISKVGTGRLQTPWNQAKAFFTDSTDFDNMNRLFNQQQLQDAVTWLKGQGSVTDAERALLAKGGFNPNGSTESNLAYANNVMGMLRKHIALQEAGGETQASGGSSATPKAGHMYSWQK